jgi:hypothetical protein
VADYGVIPRAAHTIFEIISQQVGNTNPTRTTHKSNGSSPVYSSSGGSSSSSPYPGSALASSGRGGGLKEYCVKVNFIEIYKEELKDLLDNSDGKEIHIREDETGNTSKLQWATSVNRTIKSIKIIF